MKVIHSRISNSLAPLKLNGLELLFWYLSVLQWKKLGYTTKIYVDEDNLKFIKENGLYELYDEVDTDLFHSETGIFANHIIDKERFWAVAKLLILQNEPEPCVITDYDFIPLTDKEIDFSKELIVYHSEVMHRESQYLPQETMILPDGYTVPEWFTWKAKPFNTAFCYINNKELKEKYLALAFEYVNCFEPGAYEKNDSIPVSLDMVFIEQRMLAELAYHMGIDTQELIHLNEDLILNQKYMHLFVHKLIDEKITATDRQCNGWHLFLLQKLSELDADVYTLALQNPFFEADKKYIEENGFRYKIPKPLKRTNW